MKKVYLLFPLSFFVFITCEDEKVELWVNGVSTGVTDDTEPYSLVWNTTTYEYGGQFGMTVWRKQ